MHPTPVIFECTIRDAAYVVNFQFSAAHTQLIARSLEDAGFDHIEIGHGLGLGASKPSFGIAAETDEAYLEAAASALSRARWGTCASAPSSGAASSASSTRRGGKCGIVAMAYLRPSMVVLAAIMPSISAGA